MPTVCIDFIWRVTEWLTVSSSQAALTTVINSEYFGEWGAERMWALARNMGSSHSWESKYSIDLFIFLSLGLGTGAWICVWLQLTTCFLQMEVRRSHKDNTLILLASDSHLLVLFSLEEVCGALSRTAFYLDPSRDSTQAFSTLSKHTVVRQGIPKFRVTLSLGSLCFSPGMFTQWRWFWLHRWCLAGELSPST